MRKTKIQIDYNDLNQLRFLNNLSNLASLARNKSESKVKLLDLFGWEDACIDSFLEAYNKENKDVK